MGTLQEEKSRAKPQCKCGQKTVYYRAYNGESICKECFNASIVEKVKKSISKYHMLQYGDNVGVAVSGGKDSTSLLNILREIVKGHGTKLFALTIDEGIEGYREESVRNAVSFAESLSIPILVSSYEELFGISLDDALETRAERGFKTTSCAVCGPLRRRSLDLTAKKAGVGVVATGHNLDDVLQTFYINLYAGDLERIKWLDPSYRPSRAGEEFGLRRIKPMMEIYEQELAFYAYINELPFQSESCPYMSEGIRTDIRTHLNEMERKHPGLKYSSLKTVLGIASRISLDEEESKKLKRCETCGAVCTGVVCSVCKTLKLVV